MVPTIRSHNDETPAFSDWLPIVSPSFNWSWPHLNVLKDSLNRVTAGDIDRLMIFMPPRHGKSETITVRYPAWRLERNPETRIMIGAYNSTLAKKFSRKTRRIARERVALSKDRFAVDDWETDVGGGLRAGGVGSGFTGMGAHLLIIDDPVKNRKEAESVAYRDWVYGWYTDDLYTRLEPGGAIILIMTRWHEDDLAGRILASEEGEDWTVISLPALAEENDLLGREPGEALCPERYDRDALLRIKRTEGNRFYALYQQRPQPKEGDFFKRHWFDIIPACPAPGRGLWVRYWDKASTKGDGDYTVGLLMGLIDTGELIIADVVRGQWDTEERDQIINQTLYFDERRFGSRLQTWFEQEGGSSGKDVAHAMIKRFVGHSVHAEIVSGLGNKVLRAEPFQAQAMVRNVKLVQGVWNAGYIDELASFPNGTHDDQVDTSSGALRRLVVLSEITKDSISEEAPAAGKGRYIQHVGR